MPRIQNAIYKQKLPVILLAALLTTAALMALARFPWFSGEAPRSVTVAEQGGVYDLTGVADLDKTVVRLAPGAAYYPNTYLTAENADAAVPESTGRYGELRADYLSQRFILALPDSGDVYTLTFTLSGRHAMRVYVNGRLAGQTGKAGTAKQDTEVWENNITCYAAPAGGRMDIILHSAQFFHSKRGASLAELSLYQAAAGIKTGVSTRIKGFLIMGALLCAAIFLLCVYLLQPGAKAILYFVFACLTMVLRECIQSQTWTYFPVSGNLSFMLEYMSVVLLTVFLSLYLGEYATGGFLRAVRYAAVAGSVLYGLCLLFLDSILYTAALKYYQAFLVACIVPGIVVLFWKMRRPTGEQAAALYGIAVFFLTAVRDIVMYSGILGDQHPNTPISEAAMLIFVLAQTVSLFLLSNRVAAEARTAEQKLAAEKEALEGLNRMKTEFLGNVSHELKTPLTVVNSHIQHARNSLPEGPELEEAVRSMKLIDGETARMAMMVSQLLDVSRIDEGHMAMERKRESLVELIQSMLDNYYPVFTKNHNTLNFKKEGSIPLVFCDRNRITQVLVNLIANAARHTREGKITVSVRPEAGAAAVTVSDTGEGIAAERVPHLFERYYSRSAEMEKAPAGGSTGTGLGLYICKYIVEAHGGTIAVKSEPGRGTAVRFTLPGAGGACQAP